MSIIFQNKIKKIFSEKSTDIVSVASFHVVVMLVVTSKAKRPKNAWFLFASKIDDINRIEIGYRPGTGGRGYFSASNQQASIKVPWGPPTLCKFQLRSEGEDTKSEYVFNNARNESAAFDEAIFSAFEVGKSSFANRLVTMAVSKKKSLISMYITLAQHSLGFIHHKESMHNSYGFAIDGSGISSDDILKAGGSADELQSFIDDVKKSVIVMGNVDDCNEKMLTAKVDGRRKQTDGLIESSKKKSKLMALKDGEKEELEDPSGLEKQYQNAFMGAAYIPIDNIKIAQELENQVNIYRVYDIIESLKVKYDPSQSVLVVIPEDASRALNLKDVASHNFFVVQKIHTFMALQEIDKNGELVKLPGQKSRNLLCYIISTNSSSLIHYGNNRGNEATLKFVKKTFPQDIFQIFCDLSSREEKSVALKVVERIAKINRIGADETSSLKKLCKFSDEGIKVVKEMLDRYELYETTDIKLDGRKGAINRCEKQRLTNKEFNLLAKCDEKYLVKCARNVITREVSLITVLDTYKDCQNVDKVFAALSQISGYVSKQQLKRDYPQEFDSCNLLRFAGAEVKGTKKNTQALLLEDYWKKVVSGNSEDIVAMSEFECMDFFDANVNVLKDFDLVIANLEADNPSFCSNLINNVIKTERLSYTVILIFHSEVVHTKMLSYLRNNTLDDIQIVPVYFNKMSAKVEGNIYENLLFGIVFGKLTLPDKPLKRIYSNINHVREIVERISLPKSKIAVVSSPGAQVIQIHSSDLNFTVKYFGSEASLQNFKSALSKDKTMYSSEMPLSNDIKSNDAHDDRDESTTSPIKRIAAAHDDRYESTTSPIKRNAAAMNEAINCEKSTSQMIRDIAFSDTDDSTTSANIKGSSFNGTQDSGFDHNESTGSQYDIFQESFDGEVNTADLAATIL